SENASLDNTGPIDALPQGSVLVNVYGYFPSPDEHRYPHAYSPVWDAQLGEWTAKAVKARMNKKQIDEVVVFNLAAKRPDLLTGPGGAPYGSAGVDINCAVIGFTEKAPTANLEEPAPNSPFPPRS